MSDPSNRGEQTTRLISELIDGEPSSADMADLNQLLRTAPKNAEQVVDQLLLDSLLSEEFGSESLTALVDLVGEQSLSEDVGPHAASGAALTR